MAEFNFGSLTRRHLCLRFSGPALFEVWNGRRWGLSAVRMLSPLRWLRVLVRKSSWEVRAGRWRNLNHRCYCRTGTMFDGRICLAGFGLNWWYSRYGGPVPCACDKVIAELLPHEAEPASGERAR